MVNLAQTGPAVDAKPVVFRRNSSPSGLNALRGQFPPRERQATWPGAEQTREVLEARILRPPFALNTRRQQARRAYGLGRLLDVLEEQPGETWQDRWLASGADELGLANWPEVVTAWMAARGESTMWRITKMRESLLPVICADAIRPSTQWFVNRRGGGGHLARLMASTRDPQGFARLEQLCGPGMSASTRSSALDRVAILLATKGGLVQDITVGDCLEYKEIQGSVQGRHQRHLIHYRLLHEMRVFPEHAPTSLRVFTVPGQLTVEEMIDRYRIVCQPIRNLLIDYLSERKTQLDYVTLQDHAANLGGRFWADLERQHPGIDSLDLPKDVANAWKERIRMKTAMVKTPTGERIPVTSPRLHVEFNMHSVRAFYLDIAQWALDDPARWGPWAAPSPVRESDLQTTKTRRHRKARMDQRTRERLPVLPALVRAANDLRRATTALIAAARQVQPGDLFAADGVTLRRTKVYHRSGTIRTIVEDPVTGKRRDLDWEEDDAFWAWATVEVLRHTGIRCEELRELSHHSFVQYRLPDTGELVPLLHIAPSKLDTERLLLISPELAEVLSAIVRRIRDTAGAVPSVAYYDMFERIWLPPAPLLFQRTVDGELRAFTAKSVARVLNRLLAHSGLTAPDGEPLDFTPHDFRRIFVTDAIMNGMPPHIAQLICGHADINTTMGYKAVYPEESILGHRAHLERRRALRPSEEYRTPTPEEWDEFLGSFQKRKVALGVCSRAFGTPCIHEHACVRCSMLWPDPDERPRLVEIRDNLADRIAEARDNDWPGEVAQLEVSLAGAEAKLAQMDMAATRGGTNRCGMPNLDNIVAVTIGSRPAES